ncbi:MAG: hypothetical protein MAGBODY4_01230 [Candidatus Marinimicrobia bacterium]|nr:hypothetical protein [Candidatus Neomarinimicrobiota bacterium]
MRLAKYIIFGVILCVAASVSAQFTNDFVENAPSTIGLKYVKQGHNQSAKWNSGLSKSSERIAQAGKKKAILASLILPGTGERMLDADNRGVFFSTTEAVLWLGFIGFSTYAGWRELDYQSYAKHHASVNAKGKDGQYWINIAGYDNIHDYNTVKLQNRRPEEVYPVTDEYAWDWESYDDRYTYDTIRIESRVVSQYATFTIGAIVLNHLASALDATYLYNTQLNATENSLSYQVAIPLP